MINLVDASKSEQLKFLQSFDHVLSDLDGVVWLHYKAIPGSANCLNSLKRLGKRVHYVSNNSTAPRDAVRDKLEAAGLSTNVEDIALPITAIVSYLNKIQFNKVLYVIGMDVVKDSLRSAGIAVADGVSDTYLGVGTQPLETEWGMEPQQIPETIPSIFVNISDDESVGGVLVECDINVNLIKLQKAITYLTRKDCLFIAAAGDARLPMGIATPLLGPHYFLKPIMDLTGREPYRVAKPDLNYNEFIAERFRITDPSRVLVVGDSINEDMHFATKCGYQKLLVMSGITKMEQLTNWGHPEEYKPQYYVDTLKSFYEVIQSCMANK